MDIVIAVGVGKHARGRKRHHNACQHDGPTQTDALVFATCVCGYMCTYVCVRVYLYLHVLRDANVYIIKIVSISVSRFVRRQKEHFIGKAVPEAPLLWHPHQHL